MRIFQFLFCLSGKTNVVQECSKYAEFCQKRRKLCKTLQKEKSPFTPMKTLVSLKKTSQPMKVCSQWVFPTIQPNTADRIAILRWIGIIRYAPASLCTANHNKE